jgi:NADH dehydrogenase FAD-containing subunit
VLVEPHTHFHHIFTFPRFAVVPEHEQKAFIPYTTLFASAPSPASHLVVTARVQHIDDGFLVLDREYDGSSQLPFEYLVVATGTLLSQPCGMQSDDKPGGVAYLRQHQQQVKQANSIVIAGGGAAGVQMACDIKEMFPAKIVTVVQSRDQLMPAFNRKLHDIIAQRFADLGINFLTGRRVRIPQTQTPGSPQPTDVELSDGTRIPADLVIAATGQKANNALISRLPPSNGESLLNPANGMIRVRPTLQFADQKYSNLFAVGDIADTGAHKAARPGMVQAGVVASNIVAMIEGRACEEKFVPGPAAIHLTLGMVCLLLIFRWYI